MNDLRSLQREIHALAREKGWHDEERRPAELLALCHSELSEALEEIRSGHALPQIYWQGGSGKPEGFPIEVADCVIRILDLCELYGIDLEEAIALKHKYNQTRPYRHGGRAL